MAGVNIERRADGIGRVAINRPDKRNALNDDVRNTLIALGNSNDLSLLKIAEAMTDDVSPLVSKVAHRAVKKLRKA